MNTRSLAASTLVQVLEQGSSLNTALENTLSTLQNQQDKAFIQALCYGSLRQFYRLNYLLSQLQNKAIKDQQIKALALIGLYQLQFMRVKPHAAVSETVSAVGKKKWAKPLLNAILRRYIREQQKLQTALENDQSARYSHPHWMINALQQDWGSQAEQLFSANNQQPPMSLRVNLSRISRPELLNQLSAKQITAHACQHSDSCIMLQTALPVDELPGFAGGLVSVQDSAAQLAAKLLNVEAGHNVLDACSAPGGKSAHILETYPELGQLTAIDIDTERLEKIKENFQRLNLTAKLLAGNAATPQTWWDGNKFDRILLDVPCSALGVIRRHPDIKLLRKPQDIEKLQVLQQQILEAVWPLLKPSGVIVYATCSVLKAENELQMQTFFDQHSDVDELPIHDTWGFKRPIGRQILSGTDNMDGFYYARIYKKP